MSHSLQGLGNFLRAFSTQLLALCLVAQFAAVGLCQESPSKPRPNLLLIVADDLGYSDLGCFGGEIETPHLDSLADSGVRLTQFYNIGRCCPSRASILTGQYPHRVDLGHMTTDLGQQGYRGRLSPAAITCADMLQASGYRSFLSGKWHLGTPDPTQHGFEEFYGTLVSAKTFWDPAHFIRLPERAESPTSEEGFYGTDALTDQALQFLDTARGNSEQPWFLYLAYHAPHFPLHAPAEDIARYVDRYQAGWDTIRQHRFNRMQQLRVLTKQDQLSPRSVYLDWAETDEQPIPPWEALPADRRDDLARRMAIYAAMVDRMDRNIGRVLDSLDSHSELQNTLIIFTSDNGACAEWDHLGFDIASGRNNNLHWAERLDSMGGPGTFHSVGAGWANASNTPWRLYKHYNHEGGIASPAILSWPKRVDEAGSICRTPGHIIDLVPTLLDAAGIELPPTVAKRPTLPLPGVSLLQLIEQGQPIGRRLFFEHEGNRAVRDGDWKLVALRKRPWELYDMRADRAESNNLAAQHEERVKSLAADWERWAEANNVLPLPKDYGVPYLPVSD